MRENFIVKRSNEEERGRVYEKFSPRREKLYHFTKSNLLKGELFE